MTTKPNKLLDPIIKQVLKERNDSSVEAQKVKRAETIQQLELENKGWKRAIISEKKASPKPAPVPVSPKKQAKIEKLEAELEKLNDTSE